jgi:hypothetical protein
VLDKTHNDYVYTQWIYACCAATAACFTVLLILVDIKNGVKLNASPARLKEIRAAEALAKQQPSESDPLLN